MTICLFCFHGGKGRGSPFEFFLVISMDWNAVVGFARMDTAKLVKRVLAK
jgi:hypothetical protein